MLEIIEYIKHLIGEGPLFSKFQFMMENLHKTFLRELSEVHSTTIYKKVNTDKKYIEDIKKANLDLKNYLQKCENEKEETDEKLEKIAMHNREIKKAIPMPQINSPKVEFDDNFDDFDFGTPAKVDKFAKVDLKKIKSPLSPPKSQKVENFMNNLFKK